MIGVDEAGRGAWAGPLVVAGFLFRDDSDIIEHLNDSKRLSSSQREALTPQIKSAGIYFIEIIDPADIDSMGLTHVIREAIKKIIEQMPKDIQIMLDGNFNFLSGTAYESRAMAEPKADGRYQAVMAASILAKVTRDQLMKNFELQFPGYGFATNVGYGTQKHVAALQKNGPIKIHRRSYKPVNRCL